MAYDSSASGPRGPGSVVERLVLAILGLATVVLLVTKLSLNNTAYDLNWDEFNYLSKLYLHDRGELGTALQTFHVQLFAWLRDVDGTEVDQLLAARNAIFPLRVGICVAMFLIARKLFGPVPAAFSLFVGVGFSYVIRHGETFRFDPLLSFSFTAAAALLMLRRRDAWAAWAAGALVALGLMVSIKLVIFAPTLVGVIFAPLLLAPEDRGPRRQFLHFAAATAVVFGALYAFHAPTVGKPPVSDIEFIGVASGLFAPGIDRARWTALSMTLLWDAAFWLLVLFGTVVSVLDLRKDRESATRGLIVLLFVAPVLVIPLYRNSFTYFYITLIPGAALGCGAAVAWLGRQAGDRRDLAAVLTLALALPSTIQAWRLYERTGRDTITIQRQLLLGIHEVFPEPVPYIDRCNMVSSYPKAGPLMSTLEMEAMRRGGPGKMKKIMKRYQPVFLVANIPALNIGTSWGHSGTKPHRLTKGDFEELKKNYVRHWGPLWVAGKQIKKLTTKPDKMEILIAGDYTIEGRHDVIIDDVQLVPGDVVTLEQGKHTIAASEADKPISVTLRYGDHLPRPSHMAPRGKVFTTLQLPRL